MHPKTNMRQELRGEERPVKHKGIYEDIPATDSVSKCSQRACTCKQQICCPSREHVRVERYNNNNNNNNNNHNYGCWVRPIMETKKKEGLEMWWKQMICYRAYTASPMFLCYVSCYKDKQHWMCSGVHADHIDTSSTSYRERISQ